MQVHIYCVFGSNDNLRILKGAVHGSRSLDNARRVEFNYNVCGHKILGQSAKIKILGSPIPEECHFYGDLVPI